MSSSSEINYLQIYILFVTALYVYAVYSAVAVYIQYIVCT